MAHFEPYIKRWWNLHVGTIWKDIRTKKDPDTFLPNGSQIYHGYQGEGKSISMYHAGEKLKSRYPKCLLVSNMQLTHYNAIHVTSLQVLERVLKTMDIRRDYLYFESHTELMIVLRHARNGNRGVVFMIDEIHNYFHSHDSKSMPMWVVQVFSQQRKQHLVILGTVQMWNDLIKQIRDQIDNLILCSRSWYLIKHIAIDPRTAESNYGETEYSIRKQGFFFMTEKIRNGYDTEQVINSGREIMGGNDLMPAINPTATKVKQSQHNKRFGFNRQPQSQGNK